MTLYQQTYDILDDHLYNTLGKNVPEIIEIIMGYVIQGGHPLYGVNELKYMRNLYASNIYFIKSSTSYLTRHIRCRSHREKILSIMFRAKSTELYECKEMIPQTLKMCDKVKYTGIYGTQNARLVCAGLGDIVALSSTWDMDARNNRDYMIGSNFATKTRSKIVKFPESILNIRQNNDKNEIIKMIEQFEKTKFAKSWSKKKLVKYYLSLE
jgi:hypothetical protein